MVLRPLTFHQRTVLRHAHLFERTQKNALLLDLKCAAYVDLVFVHIASQPRAIVQRVHP